MENSRIVKFLYGTVPGRGLLRILQKLHMDRLAASFLCSPLSRAVIPWYIRKNQIPMDQFRPAVYRSFQDFFLREKKKQIIDFAPDHLISPCDGWLSAFSVGENQQFRIKGSRYRLEDLIRDPETAALFAGGTCLIFRLTPADYHHYCYIDDGVQEFSRYLEGQLHSVQPIALETFPVFALNRRAWSLMETDHFGYVVQTEIGAMAVGRIVNRKYAGPFLRGEEKGRFELAGSTIALFFEKNRITLNEELRKTLEQEKEVRVALGEWIALGRPEAGRAFPDCGKEPEVCA